jgi:hypothetical protein
LYQDEDDFEVVAVLDVTYVEALEHEEWVAIGIDEFSSVPAQSRRAPVQQTQELATRRHKILTAPHAIPWTVACTNANAGVPAYRVGDARMCRLRKDVASHSS